MNLFTELKRRKVFRVAVVYAATAFAVLQGADILLPNLGVPDWVMRFLVAVVVLGFPIALVLAWALEIKPDGGIQRTEAAAAEPGETPPLLGKRTVFVAALLVVLGVGIGAGWFLRPVSGPGITPSAEHVASPVADAPAVLDKSIAVLPFTDLSPDGDQEYFSDGLAEEILNLLAAVRDLSVASRTSAFSFKGSGLPIPEIAGRLGVNYVLEGSVRKADERIRVTAQLIDARTDRHLWSDNYDRTLADVFAVQDEIAGAIGEALQIELLGPGGRRVTSETIDPEVYEQFLQARFRLRQRNDQAIAHAIAQLETVVEAEPSFARALALLAEAYTLGSAPVVDPRAEQRVEQALAIDPDLAPAVLVRGNLAMLRGNWLSAYIDAQRAIELEPQEPRPYHWIGILYGSMGYIERAEEAIELAAELEPGNANIRGWQSVLLARRGAREEAVRAALQQARLGNPVGHIQAAIYLLDSDIERAAEQLRLAEAAGSAAAPPLRPLIRIARGEADQLDPFIRALRAGEVNSYYGSAGLLVLDLDEALLQALGEMYQDHGGAVHGLFWTDDKAPLRADPRFIQFMEQMGAFPLWRELGPPPDCRAEGESFVCGLEGDA